MLLSQILWPLTTTELQVVAEVIGVCSCGGNQLIDQHNKVGGNQVKIRQTVNSCVGFRIILLKKTVMSKAFVFYLRGKILEKLCGCAL